MYTSTSRYVSHVVFTLSYHVNVWYYAHWHTVRWQCRLDMRAGYFQPYTDISICCTLHCFYSYNVFIASQGICQSPMDSPDRRHYILFCFFSLLAWRSSWTKIEGAGTFRGNNTLVTSLKLNSPIMALVTYFKTEYVTPIRLDDDCLYSIPVFNRSAG